MNCPNCGQPVEPGATFCGNCGQALLPTPAQPAPNNPMVAPAAVQPPSPAIQQPVMAPAPMPATAGSSSQQPPGERLAISALIAGVIGLPASVVPIGGLILGLTAIISGTIARRKYKHLMSLLAIIFGSLAIVASLAFFIYFYQESQKTPTTTSGVTSGPLQAIDSQCYSTKFETGLSSYTTDSCNISSSSADSPVSRYLAINAQTISGLTDATFVQAGENTLKGFAQGFNGTLTSSKLSKFAGSTAYIGTITSQKATGTYSGTVAAVYHVAPTGANLFIIANLQRGTQAPSLNTLETNWVWK